MAKHSVLADIKAKPNARGKTSHIPIECSVKNCRDEAFLHFGSFDKRKKLCFHHYNNPPRSAKQAIADTYLAQFGLKVGATGRLH